MSKYLMLINIGPVQDFIATARRSRDLWFGSWLLSELSKTAARIIVEINGQNCENLIFPSAEREDLIEYSDFNAANKILAIVEENPQSVGARINDAINNRLNTICKDAFDGIETQFDGESAKTQLKDLIEFYWTAIKFENESEYAAAREKAEYLAAARKNTREFRVVSWGANIPKSSLDGKRESVVYESSRRMRTKELYRKFKVREKEQLCGVGLLKRLGYAKNERGDRIDRFASTSHVAATPFLKNLKNMEAYLTFKKDLLDLGVDSSEFYSIPDEQRHEIFGLADGHLLYAERMRDYFDDRERIGGKEKIEKAKEILNQFLESAFDRKSPSPYYAVLLADGDNMGRAIDAQVEKENPIDAHKNLSKALSDFAGSVKEIVNERHGGSLIYAGGDDVLALVPIHTVLNCAKDLADKFAANLESFEYENEKSPTLSVGIAVAHFLEPLSDALELARTAEKAAKKVDGKNGLAVIVDKRSGTSRPISGKFGEIYERLEQLIKLHHENEVSHQLGYELRDLSNRLEVDQKHLNAGQKNTLSKIKTAETARIIDRKLSKMDKKKITQDEKEKKFGAIYKLSEKENGAKLVADELITSMIFADAKLTAKGENGKSEVGK